MPVITLPDGSQRSFEQPLTVAELAASIGAGLAKAALAGRVDGKLVDTSFLIDRDANVAIVTAKDPEGLEILRHSTAHLLAQAVQSIYPDAQVTIGPVIEDGFYYDFAFKRPFTPEDLAKFEAKMHELVKADLRVDRLLTLVNHGLRLMVIDLDTDDNPQHIFESMNVKAVPLEAADLVRNYVFQVMQSRKLDQDALYEEHWLRFEDGFWRQMINQGPRARTHLENFLVFFLVMELRNQPCVGHQPRVRGEDAGHVLPQRHDFGAERAPHQRGGEVGAAAAERGHAAIGPAADEAGQHGGGDDRRYRHAGQYLRLSPRAAPRGGYSAFKCDAHREHLRRVFCFPGFRAHFEILAFAHGEKLK